MKANAANPPPVAVVPSQVSPHAPRPTVDTEDQPAIIRLDEVVDIDGEGEDEIEEVEYEEEEDGEDGVTELIPASLEALRDQMAPGTKLFYWGGGRKRSSDEIEAEDDDDNASVEAQRGGTPPKRIRFDKGERLPGASLSPHNRLKKRSSEELEDAGSLDGGKEYGQNKKAKVSTVVEGDLSESPPPTSDSSLLSSTADEDIPGRIEKDEDLDHIFRGAERCGSLEGGER
jgi:hypothetical protein